MSKIISATPGVSSKTGKKDCTVRALANALDWSYIESHEHMQRYAGRHAGIGCFTLQLYNAYYVAGAKKITSFGRGSELNRRYLPENASIEFITIPNPTRLNHALRDTLKTGRHIVSIPGHALAVVDGKIHDLIDNNGSSLVQDIFTFEL